MPPRQARCPEAEGGAIQRQGLPVVVREDEVMTIKHSGGNEALKRTHEALGIFFFLTKRKLKWAALVKCTPLSLMCAECLIWECEPLQQRRQRTKDPFRGGDARRPWPLLLSPACRDVSAGCCWSGEVLHQVCTAWAWGGKPVDWGGGGGVGVGETC